MEDTQNAFLLTARNRILDIAKSVHEGLYAYQYMPDIVNYFPSVTCAPQRFAFSSVGGNHMATIPYELRLYTSAVKNSLSSAEGEWTPLVFASNFAYEMARRPQLQYHDSGLKWLAGDVTVELANDLTSTFPYPVGFSDAPLYWGAVFRILVPYKRSFEINIAGA